MSAQKIWDLFCEKLLSDTLTEADCTDEIGPMLIHFLKGEDTQTIRKMIVSGSPEFFDMEEKAIVKLKWPGDDLRFDFIKQGNEYRLAFMESITLPVDDITELPYSGFTSLPKWENHIHQEIEISKTIKYYNKFKELLGREAAVKIFCDGKGESIGARSWVPFYSSRLAFIAYEAWIANRINGEKAIIEKFSETCSVIRFEQHNWPQLYRVSGHLRLQIPYDEYIGLFEAIWRDRAEKSGWSVSFTYDGEDTVLTFTA